MDVDAGLENILETVEKNVVLHKYKVNIQSDQKDLICTSGLAVTAQLDQLNNLILVIIIHK